MVVLQVPELEEPEEVGYVQVLLPLLVVRVDEVLEWLVVDHGSVLEV